LYLSEDKPLILAAGYFPAAKSGLQYHKPETASCQIFELCLVRKIAACADA